MEYDVQSSEYMPVSDIAGSYGRIIFNFWEFFTLHQIVILPTVKWGSILPWKHLFY